MFDKKWPLVTFTWDQCCGMFGDGCKGKIQFVHTPSLAMSPLSEEKIETKTNGVTLV